MVFENLLDPIFNPLLKLHPALAILIISFVITMAITLVYKYTTDQKKMKTLKEEMKANQKKLRELSKKDPQKAMKMQQQAMKGNMDYMKSSFKSTLYTIIPIIIIFGWLNAHMDYSSLQPNHQFEVTAIFLQGHASTATLSTIPELEFLSNSTQEIIDNAAVWKLQGELGEYKLTIEYNSEIYDADSKNKPINLIISEQRGEYVQPVKTIKDSKLQKIIIGNERIYPLQDLIGWKLSWLWVYIIFSIAFSIGLRKVLKVY